MRSCGNGSASLPSGKGRVPVSLVQGQVAVYKQTKRQQIDPALAGRLTCILNSIAALDQGAIVDDRLAAIERQLGIGSTPRPNGHDHAGTRP
jgi:hypothetical protein